MRSRHTTAIHLWLLTVTLATLGACDIINPEETVPTTLQLQPFTFEVMPGQGTAQNKIPEVWIYANSNFLGAFAPPVNVYYLEEGPTTFTFRPGIRNNGIASDAIVYPLFDGYTLDLNASPGATYTIEPVTAYKTGTAFSLLADFELSNPFTDNRDTVTASMVTRSATDVFEGEYAGEIILTDEAYFIEVGHEVPMGDLPTDGKDAYLEFRYKNDVQFGVGLLGGNLLGETYVNFFYLVNPTADWNMLYLELTELLKASNLDTYKILFRAIYTGTVGGEPQHIYLDNVKVVHL